MKYKVEYQYDIDEETVNCCVATENGDWVATTGPEGNQEAEDNADLIVKALNNMENWEGVPNWLKAAGCKLVT